MCLQQGWAPPPLGRPQSVWPGRNYFGNFYDGTIFFSVNKWRAVKQGWSPLAFGSPFSVQSCHRGGPVQWEIVPRAAELDCHLVISLGLISFGNWKHCSLPSPYLRFSENKSPWCGRGGRAHLINHLGLEDGWTPKLTSEGISENICHSPIHPPQQVKEPRPREERLLPQGHKLISCK